MKNTKKSTSKEKRLIKNEEAFINGTLHLEEKKILKIYNSKNWAKKKFFKLTKKKKRRLIFS